MKFVLFQMLKEDSAGPVNHAFWRAGGSARKDDVEGVVEGKLVKAKRRRFCFTAGRDDFAETLHMRQPHCLVVGGCV